MKQFNQSSNRHRSEQGFLHDRSPTKSLRKSARAHENLSTKVVGYGNNHLPPTPDTMSTATVGANSSTQSIVTERSLTDGVVVPSNGFASLVQDSRPKSSGSTSTYHSSGHLEHQNGSVGLGVSNDDLKSTQVEQSENDFHSNDAARISEPRRSNSPFKARRFVDSNPPIRPVLATHVTDIMFNGEGFMPKDPLRNASYPSPSRLNRPYHGQTSPNSRRNSGAPNEKAITSLRQPSQSRVLSPASGPYQEVKNEDTQAAFSGQPNLSLHAPNSQQAAENNPTTTQSVASRFFRRTINQGVNDTVTNRESAQARPPSRPHLSRPSSIHGQTHPQRPRIHSVLPDGMLTS